MQTHLDKGTVSLAMALDPDSCKVDDRDHCDRLAFAADFARLIVYYDKTNQAAGDWRRFFLKDPAILMAAISKTDTLSYYVAPGDPKGGDGTLCEDAALRLVSQMCVLCTQMFVLLDQWFHLMSQDAERYLLHAFLKNRIDSVLAEQLGQMITLHQALSISSNGLLEPLDGSAFSRFESIWQAPRNNLSRPLLATSDPLILRNELKRVYHALFDVFSQVVSHARQAFDELQLAATRYPDTALLMVFSRLMEVQQREINLIGRKHLDFYYQRVLQQELQAAHADELYVFLTLAANADALVLPAGTPFKAGRYADGSDIIFVNDREAQINSATVTQVKTLFRSNSAVHSGLFINDIAPAGQLLAYDLSGGGYRVAFDSAQSTPVQQGFAIASPLLLLQGGSRTITVELHVSPADSAVVSPLGSLMKDATYCLSTATGWLDVTPRPLPDEAQGELITLCFVLQPGDPPIVASTDAAHALRSPWPQLKVLLGASQTLIHPPILDLVNITVVVVGLTQLALANDTAVLPVTGSAHLFGPVPGVGQSFYLGSNECFAKPLVSLEVNIDWDHLPHDFADYYSAYNDYLKTPPFNQQTNEFSNSAFAVTWQLLKDNSWNEVLATTSLPDMSNPDQPGKTPLFQQNTDGTNADQSTFSLAPGSGNPFTGTADLALMPLPQVAKASNGYLRMQLAAPEHGFGQSLYAGLVTWVSLKNAQLLMGQTQAANASFWSRLYNRLWGEQTEPALIGLPNVPFSPQKLSVSITYTATASTAIKMSLSQPAKGSPLTFYHYGSFKAYPVYQAGLSKPRNNSLPLIPVTLSGDADLPLFPGKAGEGYLYVALSEVKLPGTVSLFVEIVTDEPCVASNKELTCFGWQAPGWQALTVLQDSTGNLSRSGIITVQLPEPVANAPTEDEVFSVRSPAMPGNDFWLMIEVPDQNHKLRLGRIQAQAVKLRRSNLASVPQGTTPTIDANSIVSPLPKVAVAQPFASFGGQPSEDMASFDRPNSFYRRVSKRLNHKDRASSQGQYVDLAHEACANLYYARVLVNKKQPGVICLGVVKGYASAQLTGAFAPLLSSSDQQSIGQYLTPRASAMARISVRNLKHQMVTLELKLIASAQTNCNALAQELNEQLRLYLSPWITSDSPQMDIAQGLRRSELIGMISQHPEVLVVTLLVIRIEGQLDDAVEPEADALLISAPQHLITCTPPSSGEAEHG